MYDLMIGTYHFDQFNVKVDIPRYTDEEYENVLQGISPQNDINEIPTGRETKPTTCGKCARTLTYAG
jgi:hypothetical protein